MPRGMKVSDCIGRLEVMNKCLPLIDRMTDKLSERETICKTITYSQCPKNVGKGTTF